MICYEWLWPFTTDFNPLMPGEVKAKHKQEWKLWKQVVGNSSARDAPKIKSLTFAFESIACKNNNSHELLK